MLGRPAALAAGLASVLAAASAHAQPKSANRPAQDVANDLVKQAITKSQQGDHLGAIDLYLNAYTLIPQHTLLSNVGNEYLEAGKPVEALKYFCMYLDKDPTGTNATYALSKAKTIQIDLGNKDVDDRTACKPPRKERPKPEEPPAGGGTTGTAGLDKAKPAGGGDEGGSPGGTLKLAGLVTGAVGLAVVGVGVYYGTKARERSDFISNHNPADPWPDNLRQIEADGQAYENRQIYLSIAGGALTATGVVLFILGATKTGPEKSGDSKGEKADKLTLRPTAAPGSIGLTLGRGF
jgi:hypothetical protein